MIFICDHQFPISLPANIKHLKASTYKEACVIYKSLYNLTDDVFEKVRGIDILTEGNSLDDKSIIKILKQFSADIEDYQQEKNLINEIWNEFPEEKDLRDIAKRVKIENLIKKATITFLESGKKAKKVLDSFVRNPDSFLFITSHIKNNSLLLIEELPDSKVTIRTENSTGKVYNGDNSHTIGRKKYLQLNSELLHLRQQFAKLEKEPWKNRGYKPEDPLKYFENSLYKKLDPRTKSSNTKVHFYGQDLLLADRAIKMILMGAESPKYYSMPMELEIIETDDKPTVILNFDSINDPNSYYRLKERVKNIEDIVYVILQAIRNVNSKYFSYYEAIEIPKINEIRKHITGIFISFLADNNCYRDDYRKLATLDKYNLLEKVIPQFDNLETLYKCTKEFSELKFDDLLNNIDFWHILEENVNQEVIRKQNQSKLQQLRNVSFTHKDDEWEILGLGAPFRLPYPRNMGLLYLAVVLKSEKSLTSSEVRKIAYLSMSKEKISKKKHSNKNNKIITYENNFRDRSTISSAIDRIKKIPQIKEFIEEYVNFGENENSLNSKNKIEVEVIDPNIEDTFFQ